MTGTMPLRIELSNTYRGIFVMRYLLFAGGLAVLGGVLERLVRGADHSLLGLLAGLVMGLVLFRSQLKPLRFPRLVLSQDALYILKAGTPTRLAWQDIRDIRAQGDSITLEVPQAPGLQLTAKELGSEAGTLASRLQRFRSDAVFRANLPDDKRTRASLGL